MMTTFFRANGQDVLSVPFSSDFYGGADNNGSPGETILNSEIWKTETAGRSRNNWSGDRTGMDSSAAAKAAAGITYGAKYLWDTDNAADAWLISKPIALEQGKTYTVTVWARTKNSTERFRVMAVTGDANTTAADLKAGTEILNRNAYKNNSDNFEEITVSFSPSVTGNYVIGINCYSEADMDTLYIGRIKIVDSDAQDGGDEGDDNPGGGDDNPGGGDEEDESIVLAESFAGAQTPANWVFEPVEGKGNYNWGVGSTSKSSPSPSPQDNDGGLAYFNCYSISAGNEARLISPSINSEASDYPVLSFWFYHSTNGSQQDKVVVEISKDNGEWTELGSILRITAGETNGWKEYTYNLLSAIEGSQTYRIAFRAVSNYGYDVAIDNINIKDDLLAYFKIMDFTVTPVETGYSLDWTAPVTTETLTYDIVRYVNGEESQTFNDVTTKPFVDEYEPEDIVMLSYSITGKTPTVSTSATVYPAFQAGTAALPLADSFANAKMKDFWTVETTNNYKWEPSSNVNTISATPQDQDGGLLYYNTNMSQVGNYTRLISPPIKTSSVTAPAVSFYFYHYTPAKDSNKLVIEIKKDNGQWETVETIQQNQATSNGWVKHVCTIREAIEGSTTFQVSFKGEPAWNDAMALDNILIANDPQAYFKITNFKVTPAEGGYNLDWTAPDSEESVTYDIVRYVNGEESATISDLTGTHYFDEYEPEGLETIYYTVTGKTESLSTETVACSEFMAGSLSLPFSDSFAEEKMNPYWTIEKEGSDYKWQTISSISYNPAVSPQDGDGGMIYYNTYNASNGATSTLITPPLSTASSKNPQLSFWVFGTLPSAANLKVLVSKDGGEWTQIEGADITISFITGWTEFKFNLLPYITESLTYQVAFRGTSDNGQNRLAMDNISIINVAEYDLAVSEITGPTTIIAGNDAEYKFTVSNQGAYNVTSEDYAISLDCEGLELEDLELKEIEAGASVEYSFTVSYTAHEVKDEPYVFNINIEYDGDEVEANNSSSAETTVSVSDKNSVSVFNAELNGEDADRVITLTWEPVVDMDGYEAVDYAESFENLEKGTTDNFNGFTAVRECETSESGSWFGQAPTPFMVSTRLASSWSTGPAVADGEKYIVAVNEKALNEWLISPELNCFSASTMNLSFDIYFYEGDTSDTRTMEVLYSTTENSTESFTHTIKSVSKPTAGQWLHYSYEEIPAEAKYLAIHVVANSTYSIGLLIDNVKITDAFEPVLGYHVYEEGVGRLNEEMLEPTATSYEVEVTPEYGSSAEKTTRSFTMTAVYAEGESAKSVAASVEIEKLVPSITLDEVKVSENETVKIDLSYTAKNIPADAEVNAYVTCDQPSFTQSQPASEGTVTLTIEEWEEGTYKVVVKAERDGEVIAESNEETFTLHTMGIESIEGIDADARYFDLQGFEVKNPAEGRVYIQVKGNKASKVLVK